MDDPPAFQNNLHNVAERSSAFFSQDLIEQTNERAVLKLFDRLGLRKNADPVEMDRFISGEQAVEHALLRAFRKQAHLRSEVHATFLDVVGFGQNAMAAT